eukprot:Em0002g1097a
MADQTLIAAAFSAMTGVEVRPSSYKPQSPDDVPAGTLSMYELFRSTYVMQPAELVFHAGGDMEVHIMTLTGNRSTISVSAFTTIAHLKISISAKAGVPPCEQRLIYNGRQLVDQETIETAGIYRTVLRYTSSSRYEGEAVPGTLWMIPSCTLGTITISPVWMTRARRFREEATRTGDRAGGNVTPSKFSGKLSSTPTMAGSRMERKDGPSHITERASRAHEASLEKGS